MSEGRSVDGKDDAWVADGWDILSFKESHRDGHKCSRSNMEMLPFVYAESVVIEYGYIGYSKAGHASCLWLGGSTWFSRDSIGWASAWASRVAWFIGGEWLATSALAISTAARTVSLTAPAAPASLTTRAVGSCSWQ